MNIRWFVNPLAIVALLGPAVAPGWAQEPPAAEVNEEEGRLVIEGREAIAVPAPPAPAIPQAQIDAEADDLLDKLRPILRAELHLIRTVCKTSKDDQSALRKQGERIIRTIARTTAEAQLKLQQGVVDGPLPNAVELMLERLSVAVALRLTPEEAAPYKAEVEARSRSSRDAGARCLVSRFDGLLRLGPDQRAKIADSLAESNAGIDRTMDQILNNNDGDYPSVPEDAFVPHLDARQRAIFGGAGQRGESLSFEVGVVGIETDPDDLGGEDDPADDDPVDAARDKIRRALNRLIREVSGVARRGWHANPGCVSVGD